mmetsp:Transcript_5002/g.7022  ORF Transcript_5002/g.7022 Transcript_5002/m.7022 type:complete len:233 (-) Transcript_5002:51-749(-)
MTFVRYTLPFRRANISYKPLTPPLVSKAVDCIAHTFANSKDPFTVSLKLSSTQWGVMSQMFVQRAAAKEIPLSVVAYNEELDRVEGVIINEDWKESPPHQYRELHDWRPVRAIFSELHTKFKAERPRIEHGKVLHPLYFTCVRPESRKHGIATNLWNSSVEIATALNYTHMVAEASAVASISLCKKLGFQEVASIAYQDFKFEGDKVFAGLDKTEYEKMAIVERSIIQDLFI